MNKLQDLVEEKKPESVASQKIVKSATTSVGATQKKKKRARSNTFKGVLQAAIHGLLLERGGHLESIKVDEKVRPDSDNTYVIVRDIDGFGFNLMEDCNGKIKVDCVKGKRKY